MKIDRLHELLEENDGHVSFWGNCHDCGSECCVSATALKDGIEIEGGAVYETVPEKFFIKCDACFGKNHTLTNYMETTVYARCVGYLTPVNQWNEGKRAEFRDRVNYKL